MDLDTDSLIGKAKPIHVSKTKQGFVDHFL